MSADSPPRGHTWRPITLPVDVGSLERLEMRALERLWNGQRRRLEEHGAWKPFWERMARWWSIETGVIEGIFDVSLGTTRVLVEQGFIASLIPHGEADRPATELLQILGDHKASLDMVMDVVGGSRKLSVGWIKELHALLCSHQTTADAIEQFGTRLKMPLTRGAFKTRPNTVILPDGSVHEYCPPEQTASEMDRLVELYHQLPRAIPEVRSAWLHHAFTQIHPFEDGNGRVARALASIDFIKAGLFPVLIDRRDRDRTYVPALIQADRGDLDSLVRLFCERQERGVRKAISEAELAVLPYEALGDTLDAANRKLARRADEANEGREQMLKRFTALKGAAAKRLQATAERVQAKVDKVRATVHQKDAVSAHYFRAQIVGEAKRNDYWADLKNPWEWVRLQLKDGGLTDLVIVLHFVGNPSPGAAVAAAFVSHRASVSDKRIGEIEPLEIDPLMLYPDETPTNQETRFDRWLGEAERLAIALWVRYL